MSTRKIAVLVACAATLAVSTSAMSQDTTRTRDSLARMQMQPPARMMTAQVRDSLIAQLLDSANRVTNPTIAQQLRDSVTTLRSMSVTADSMNMRMQSDTAMNRQNMQMTPQQRAQQQNMQRNMQQNAAQDTTPTSQQTYQQRQATSDQRLRVRKDWSNNTDPSGTNQPPASNRP